MKKTGDLKSGAPKLKPPTYQPSSKELNQEFDMPGASIKEVRKAFFKPLDPKEGSQKPKK